MSNDDDQDGTGCRNTRVTVQVLLRADGGYVVRLTRFSGNGETARSDFPVEKHEGGRRGAEDLAESILNFLQLGLDPSVLLPGSGAHEV